MEGSFSKRELWGSEMGFLFAAVGSAVGLGNIWRFSYMAYDNGGGAFLIPYTIALLTVGIPLLILEFGIGHERIGSAPLAFAKISPRWEVLGWWAVVFVMFGIVLYYTVIISWCLNYLVFSLSLSWGSDPDAFFFKEFLGISSGPGEVGTVRGNILAGLIIIWILNGVIVYRGVAKGIELANRIFMPILLVLTIVLVGWSLTLDGAWSGIQAYLVPDFSVLVKPKVWLDAFSQIFFTLSLGFGIMIAYASYLPRKANILRNAILTGVINGGYSIFAGFAVFSILGYMAFEEQKEISEVVSQSIGLAFVAYPKALSLLPGGAVFGTIFFASLVVAGLSSSISILEAFTSAAVDKFGWDRKQIVIVISVLGLLGGLIFTTQGGLFWLDIVDHFITAYGLVLVGLMEAVLVGWMFKVERLRKHINAVSNWTLGPWWSFLIKFIVPIVLMVILGSTLYGEFQKPYEGYTWGALLWIGVNWLVLTFIAALVFTWMPWKRKIA